jgi:MFS family permease
MSRLPAFAPFRIRSFRFQWPADLLTSWAFEMETLILGWYVLVETNSVLLLTVYGSLLYVGTLISPIIGVWSDRIGHRNMLSAMRAAYTAVAAILMVLAFTHLLNPILVLVMATFSGLVRPSDVGLRGTLVAETMPPDHLTSAMSISRTTGDTARIAGALTGAGLFAAVGMGPAYVAITVFYLASAVLTWLTGAPLVAQRTGNELKLSPWRELWMGLVHVWNTPTLLAIVWYAFLFNLAAFSITGGLLPYVARDVYHIDQTGLGYLVASIGVGALTGAIVLTRTSVNIPLPKVMTVAAVVWFVLLFLFAQTTSVIGGVVLLVLCGFAQSLAMVCHTVILLRATGQKLRGRVTGVRMLAIYTLPIGLLSAGALVEVIGFRATVSIYSVTGLIFTLLIAVRWRASLWRLQKIDAD